MTKVVQRKKAIYKRTRKQVQLESIRTWRSRMLPCEQCQQVTSYDYQKQKQVVTFAIPRKSGQVELVSSVRLWVCRGCRDSYLISSKESMNIFNVAKRRFKLKNKLDLQVVKMEFSTEEQIKEFCIVDGYVTPLTEKNNSLNDLDINCSYWEVLPGEPVSVSWEELFDSGLGGVKEIHSVSQAEEFASQNQQSEL